MAQTHRERGLVGAQRPSAEAAEQRALVDALAVAHRIGQFHLRRPLAHPHPQMRAAGLVNGARLDEPELAEHGQAAGRRGGAHGAESVGGGLGQIGVGHAEVVVGSVALQRAQLAVHLGHDVMIRRGVGQDALVDGGVSAPVEQMYPRRLPIAPGPTAHLVELHVAEGQMVQHHVPDVGDIHPFSEGRGGHEHLQVVATEQLLDALALVAGEPRVVEADHAGELRTRRRSMRASATECSREFT